MKKLFFRMMVFMSKRMIACDEASFLISGSRDHRLGFKKWWKLKMHLLTCHICRKYARQIAQLHSLLDRYREDTEKGPCTHHLPEESGERIRKVVIRELNAN
jgi:hypothetical protein